MDTPYICPYVLLDVPQELNLSSSRSFGGGELYGEKLVRLVYVDEAGLKRVGREWAESTFAP